VSDKHGPPPEERIREREARRVGDRDMTPAVGVRGEPGPWRRAVEGAGVKLFRGRFADARWSFLYDKDTRYAPHRGGLSAEKPPEAALGDGGPEVATTAADGGPAAAERVARRGEEVPVPVTGPILHPNVWSWEVPVYFWFGGMASGASFAALACDVAGDHRSARVLRMVAAGAIGPGAPLLILDLGRPERFLHMLRIFKTRSPMSMGSWCLSAFSTCAGGAVAADLLGRERTARALGAATALAGTYLGAYTGVLLASTAVPVWNRSRTFLPPIFICTATATGAAAGRLTLAALGGDRRTRAGLAALETLAMGTELVLSQVNERRLGPLKEALEGRLLRAAKAGVTAGLASRAIRKPWAGHAASALFLTAGLAFRLAWVRAGRRSALDHEAVAANARRR
jgi:DMSO reductase anchor subunit